MCTTSRAPTPRAPEVKDPIYMRNPWLDGLGIGAEGHGRNSLRIDLGSAVPQPGQGGPARPTPPNVIATPGHGSGGLGIGGGGIAAGQGGRNSRMVYTNVR